MHRQASEVLQETAPRRRPRRARPAAGGAATAVLSALTESGEILVTLEDGSAPLPARSTVELSRADIGREVVVMFERGNPQRPIILGRLQPACPSQPEPVDVKLDGQTLLLTAEREIVLRCGKSSITLTRCGKVLIRGAYLLSRSSGANRIKGGSVQIN